MINATFSNISAISSRPVLVVEKAREPPTTGKQLVNFITCGCESSAHFFVYFIHKPNSSEADYINNHILNMFKYIFNIQLIIKL